MTYEHANTLNAYAAARPGLSAAELTAAANAESAAAEYVLSETWINFTSLQNRLELGRSGEIRVAFEAVVNAQSDPAAKADYQSYLDALKGKGLDFGCQKTQDLLPSFVPTVITQAECDTMLAWGRRYLPAGPKAALGRDVVDQDWADAAAIVVAGAEAATAADAWQAFVNERVNPWKADPAHVAAPTIAELIERLS